MFAHTQKTTGTHFQPRSKSQQKMMMFEKKKARLKMISRDRGSLTMSRL